jgi:hypothetical protein
MLRKGSSSGRRAAAETYSLIGSARLNDLDPEALRDVQTESPIRSIVPASRCLGQSSNPRRELLLESARVGIS